MAREDRVGQRRVALEPGHRSCGERALACKPGPVCGALPGVAASFGLLVGRVSGGEVRGDSAVLGVFVEGVARAYPVDVMDMHEIVNDTFGDKP